MSESESEREQPDQETRQPAQAGGEPPPDPPGPAETTDPLPPVQAEPPPPESTINEQTAALPLLDLLAPQQRSGATPGTPPAGVPGPVQPAPGYGDLYSTELLSGRTYATHGYPTVPPPPAPGALPADPAGTMVGYAPPPPPRRPGPRGWPLVAAIAAAVVLLGLIGWLAIDSLPGGRPAASTTPATPTSAVMVADGYQFTQHGARADADCASNAYGQVADFFRENPCSGLRRLLFTSSAGGKPVVVSVSTVTMPDEPTAAALKKLADTNGTGNVSDLLRAGVRVPSVPTSFSDASYASRHSGKVVVIVESDYTDPAQRSDDTLERITEAAIQLGQGG